jgi:CheY-like chemotaxis protein
MPAKKRIKSSGKVLVVEDNPDFRNILALVLGAISCQVIEATDGPQAIAKAAAETPDLIIMDLGLPEMNGLEASAAIKGNQKTAHIPIVAYTVWGDEFKDRALDIGIVDFLSKPTPPDQLTMILRQFLPANA